MSFNPQKKDVKQAKPWEREPEVRENQRERVSFEKIPRNSEAEKSFLSICMREEEGYAINGCDLIASNFYEECNKAIFMAMQKLVELGRPVDVANLIQIGRERKALDRMGGEDYLETLSTRSQSKSNAQVYAEIIKTTATQRWAIATANRVIFEATEGNFTSEQMKNMVETALSKNYPVNEIFKKDTVSESFAKMKAEIAENVRLPGRFVGIKTGIYSIDASILGLEPCYFVIAARPSVGKSAIATQMVMNMAMAGHKVFVASPEMTTYDQLRRMVCMDSEVHARKMKSGYMLPQEHKAVNASIDRMDALVNKNIRFDDQGDMNPSQIRSRALQFKRENGGKLDVIVVDYLQFLTYDEKTNNMYERVSNISSDLKNIGKELKCVIIALAQIGRLEEDVEPKMHNLKDSGKIEQDADIIGILHRKLKRCEQTKFNDIISFTIAKGRNIGMHSSLLMFNPNITKFFEMDPYLEKTLSLTNKEFENLDKAPVVEEPVAEQEQETQKEEKSPFEQQ